MDVLEYLSPSTIPDITSRHTLATTITPINDQALHTTFVSGSSSSSSPNHNTKKQPPILVNDLSARGTISAPTKTDAFVMMNGSSSSSSMSNIISNVVSSTGRFLPKTAALLQQKVCQYVSFLWRVSPPVLHVNPLSPNDYRAEQLQNFFGSTNMNNNSNNNMVAIQGARTAATVARFVALHPHRRLIAIATPHEGSSSHSVIVVYDLSSTSSQQQQQPKQVIRNITVKDLCGISWKPGSRNVLVAHGVLGVSLFHLSIDPKTGLDVEDSKNRNLFGDNNNGGGLNNSSNNNRNVGGHAALVLPAAGAATNSSSPMMRNVDLGVACVYPVSAQLARFGIEPQIDRVSFYPDTGRFLACASTSSSGIRVVDLAFSPMEQLYTDWHTSSKTEASGKKQLLKPTNKLISGTFCGSPNGATIDLAWIHPSTETSTTLLLLRAIKDSKSLELFAAGVTNPIATLKTEHPVEQINVSMWPNLANVASQQSLDSRNASLGLDSKSNPLLPEPKPNRHVPLWVLYQKAEGVVLYDLAFNEQTLHKQTPVYCLPLIRLSTTVASPVRQMQNLYNSSSAISSQISNCITHPGGVVSRFSIVKEVGSSDSGTVFMSVDSGHIVAVKISRNGMQQTQNSANSSFVYQTTVISPTIDDDEDGNNGSNSSNTFSELVGVFGSTSQPFGSNDSYSVVAWNGQENVAKLVTVKMPRCEKNPPPE